MGESVSLLREPDAGDPPVRFDERDVETEEGEPSEAPANETAGNRQAQPKPPRHISTLPQAYIYRDFCELAEQKRIRS